MDTILAHNPKRANDSSIAGYSLALTFRGLATYLRLPVGPIQSQGLGFVFVAVRRHSGVGRRQIMRSTGASDTPGWALRQSWVFAYILARLIQGSFSWRAMNFDSVSGAGI